MYLLDICTNSDILQVLVLIRLALRIITIIFLLVFSIKTLVEYLRNNLLLYLNQKLDLSIITKTIQKMLSLPYSYYKNKTTGEMISRINDLFYIKNVISKIIVTIFLDIILSIVTFIILFNINKTMSLYLIIITIIYTIIFIVFKRRGTLDEIILSTRLIQTYYRSGNPPKSSFPYSGRTAKAI